MIILFLTVYVLQGPIQIYTGSVCDVTFGRFFRVLKPFGFQLFYSLNLVLVFRWRGVTIVVLFCWLPNMDAIRWLAFQVSEASFYYSIDLSHFVKRSAVFCYWKLVFSSILWCSRESELLTYSAHYSYWWDPWWLERRCIATAFCQLHVNVESTRIGCILITEEVILSRGKISLCLSTLLCSVYLLELVPLCSLVKLNYIFDIPYERSTVVWVILELYDVRGDEKHVSVCTSGHSSSVFFLPRNLVLRNLFFLPLDLSCPMNSIRLCCGSLSHVF